MPNANGLLSKQNLAVYGLIALVGGGGGALGASTHDHKGTAENTEDISTNTQDITDLKVVQGRVDVRLDNIDKNLEEIEQKNDDILKAIEGLED